MSESALEFVFLDDSWMTIIEVWPAFWISPSATGKLSNVWTWLCRRFAIRRLQPGMLDSVMEWWGAVFAKRNKRGSETYCSRTEWSWLPEAEHLWIAEWCYINVWLQLQKVLQMLIMAEKHGTATLLSTLGLCAIDWVIGHWLGHQWLGRVIDYGLGLSLCIWQITPVITHAYWIPRRST